LVLTQFFFTTINLKVFIAKMKDNYQTKYNDNKTLLNTVKVFAQGQAEGLIPSGSRKRDYQVLKTD
jgi:hypothetical protein